MLVLYEQQHGNLLAYQKPKCHLLNLNAMLSRPSLRGGQLVIFSVLSAWKKLLLYTNVNTLVNERIGNNKFNVKKWERWQWLTRENLMFFSA